MKRDGPYLKHMFDAVTKIEGYTRGMEREAFVSNPMIQDAVVGNLEIVGEATKRLSSETRQLYPELPWSQVAGTRDRLIHAYFDLDLNEVWTMVERDIPRLRSTVEKAIAKLDAY